MLMEYEMLMRLSTIKAEKGELNPDGERVLATCMAAWDDYVWNAMELIKRGLERRPVLRMPYQSAITSFNPGNLGPQIMDSLDYAEFRREELMDNAGNISDLSLRLAATMFCKKQMERIMKTV